MSLSTLEKISTLGTTLPAPGGKAAHGGTPVILQPENFRERPYALERLYSGHYPGGNGRLRGRVTVPMLGEGPGGQAGGSRRLAPVLLCGGAEELGRGAALAASLSRPDHLLISTVESLSGARREESPVFPTHAIHCVIQEPKGFHKSLMINHLLLQGLERRNHHQLCGGWPGGSRTSTAGQISAARWQI
jgi:hypothetical protein